MPQNQFKRKNKRIRNFKIFQIWFVYKIVEQNLSILYLIGFEQFDNLKKYSDLSVDYVKKKIEIELLWNNLIYEKYKNKLSIDVDKIKEDLKFKIENQNKVEEYKLAEILFTPQSKSTENEEIEEIKESIKKIGFESSAIAYSISNTASKGEYRW